MGSGHVLVYSFDVFMQLYTTEGFRERDAAELIMTNNLFGLEIDKRAYQLAYFAIMMKGREYNRRILSKEIKLNLHQFIDTPEIPNEYFERLSEVSPYSHELTTTLLSQLTRLLNHFKNATEIGSILKIEEPQQSELDQLDQFVRSFEIFSNMDILYQLPEIQTKVISILDITRLLMTRYTAVTTNPPYLNKMSPNLDKYVKKNYPDVKTDLFSVFIKMNSNILLDGGYAGFMTPFVWMFIKSYEELRSFLITNKSISSLVQMEYSAFEEATVPVCCFMIKNAKTEPVGNYFKLSDFKGGMKVQKNKILEAIKKTSVDYFYQTNQNNFKKIPGLPVSFWASETAVKDFSSGDIIQKLGDAKQGLIPGNTIAFLRLWYEVSTNRIGFNNHKYSDILKYRKKWFPYNKGGSFRRWYGNLDFLINMKNNGHDIQFSGLNNNHRLRESSLYFKEVLTWSKISSGSFSMRYLPEGTIFDIAGCSVFNVEDKFYVLGAMNSKAVSYLLRMISPTLNYEVDHIKKIPIIFSDKDTEYNVRNFVKNNISNSMLDWNSFETSWEFKKHPLI